MKVDSGSTTEGRRQERKDDEEKGESRMRELHAVSGRRNGQAIGVTLMVVFRSAKESSTEHRHRIRYYGTEIRTHPYTHG